MDDWQLVNEYAARGSEAAFTELVGRHVNLVYSAALRKLRDRQAAEETTQAVFCLLAQKAGRLGRKVSIPGWLYQTACFKAGEHLRADQRRRHRQQHPHTMENLHPGPETPNEWEQVAPLLEDAMRHLGEADRVAILLRYFQNQPLREVGKALGLDEDAARKRVGRALEKLRAWLAGRGVTASASALAAVLSAQATNAAPATSAMLLAQAALATSAGAMAAGWSTVSFLKLTPLMALTKSPVLPILAVALLIGIPAGYQWNQLRQLRREVEDLRLVRDNAQAASTATREPAVDAREQARLSAEHAELLRLRGEVAALRRQAVAAANRPIKPSAERGEKDPDAESWMPYTVNLSANVPPGHTMMVGGWSMNPGKRVVALITPEGDPNGSPGASLIVRAKLIELSESAMDEAGLGQFKSDQPASNLNSLFSPAQTGVLLKQLEGREGVDVLSAPAISTVNGREGSFFVGGNTDHNSISVGVLPTFTPDRQLVDLKLNVKVAPPTAKP